MLKESQNGGDFKSYVWIESRMNNRSHVMQEATWGSAQFRVHLIKFPDLCVTKRLQFHVLFSLIEPGSTKERGK
jgi:hypothetical protein